MTDITPRPAQRRRATLIGTWSGLGRVLAVRMPASFHDAPILATGVIGLLAGLWIAQWSQEQIASYSPLAGNTPGMETAAISAMSWLADDKAVVFFGGGRKPVFFFPSGRISLEPPELPGLATDHAARSASIAQLAEDGVLTARTSSFEVVTPGGLAAIDGTGSLYVTGAARIRNTDKSGERGVEPIAPNGQTVWRTSAAIESSQTGQPTQFLPALRWDTAVTAMVALPNPSHIAVGGADGRIAFLGDDQTPRLSADLTAAQKGIGSHGAPVVALAAARVWNPGGGGAQFASAASDGSIKVWFPLDVALISRDVLFPQDALLPVFAPDSLELSDDGKLLTVRTPAGAIFAARLGDAKVIEATAAASFDTITLANLRLGYPVTASALSRGSGTSLYVAASDCSVREVDLAKLTDGAPPVTPSGTLPVSGAPPVPANPPLSLPTKLTLRGHGGPISRLAASNDDRYLAAASLDGLVRIHHLSSLRYLAALPLADIPTGPICTSTAELPPSEAQPSPAQQPLVWSDDEDCPGRRGLECPWYYRQRK